MRTIFLTVLALSASISLAHADTCGVLYEQVNPVKGVDEPSFELSANGHTVVSNGESLDLFISSPDVCGSCKYSIYWSASGGHFECEDDHHQMIVWTPPSVSSDSEYLISATLQDGKGHIAVQTVNIRVSVSGDTEESQFESKLEDRPRYDSRGYVKPLPQKFGDSIRPEYKVDEGSVLTIPLAEINISELNKLNIEIKSVHNHKIPRENIKIITRDSMAYLQVTIPNNFTGQAVIMFKTPYDGRIFRSEVKIKSNSSGGVWGRSTWQASTWR